MNTRAACGFTLIEVLVALAIVAITLGAGIKAAGALTGNTQRLADTTAAQWCADNRLTALRLSGLTPPIGELSFECAQLGQNYIGMLTVRPSNQNNFVIVDASVADEAGQSILRLTTLLRR